MGDSWTVNLRSDTAVEAIAPALERAFGVAQSDVYVVPPPDSPAPAAVGVPPVVIVPPDPLWDNGFACEVTVADELLGALGLDVRGFAERLCRELSTWAMVDDGDAAPWVWRYVGPDGGSGRVVCDEDAEGWVVEYAYEALSFAPEVEVRAEMVWDEGSGGFVVRRRERPGL